MQYIQFDRNSKDFNLGIINYYPINICLYSYKTTRALKLIPTHNFF